MGRILAIDYGQKRTGIAVTDPLQIIATGLGTFNTHDVFRFLEQYVVKENVEEIVVGYPKTLRNEPAEVVVHLEPFLKGLRNKFKTIPIKLTDERYTSKMAFQTMIDSGLKKKDRQNKEIIDEVSATIILQSYLEFKINMQS